MSAPYAKTVMTDKGSSQAGAAGRPRADGRPTAGDQSRTDGQTRTDSQRHADGQPGTDGQPPTDAQRADGPPSARGRALVAAVLGAAFLSASAVLIKLADTGPATAAFYRCFLALPVLIALAVVERRRRGPRRPAAHLGAILAGAFLSVDLVLWNHAIADVGAGIATVLGNLQVLFVALAAWVLLRERPGRRFLLALPVVMTGVVLVSGLAGAGAGDIHPLAGIVFGLGTSVAYTAFLLILRQTSAGTPHIAGPLAEVTTVAALGSLLLGLAFGGLRLDVP